MHMYRYAYILKSLSFFGVYMYILLYCLAWFLPISITTSCNAAAADNNKLFFFVIFLSSLSLLRYVVVFVFMYNLFFWIAHTYMYVCTYERGTKGKDIMHNFLFLWCFHFQTVLFTIFMYTYSQSEREEDEGNERERDERMNTYALYY